jgi:cell division protease FtsH
MMITQGGFSKKLGQIAWSGGNQNTFVGQQMGQPADCSGETSDEIDQEVKALVDRAYRYILALFMSPKMRAEFDVYSFLFLERKQSFCSYQ